MLLKKIMALLFFMCLISFLFYAGLNMAEEGTKSLLGIEDNPQAFRIVSGEEGDLHIYWSGNSRTVNVGFITEKTLSLKASLQTTIQKYFSRVTRVAEENEVR